MGNVFAGFSVPGGYVFDPSKLLYSSQDSSCGVLNDIQEIIKVIEKESQSSGQILFARDIKNLKDVAIKMFYEPPLRDNGILIEAKIYKNIISILLDNKNTGNLFSFIYFEKCSSNAVNEIAKKIRYSKEVKNFIRQMEELKKDTPDPSSVYFLCIEKGKDVQTLDEWFSSERRLLDVKSVVFQIFYNLQLFNKIVLRHNDLHAGNILVRDYKKDMYAKYTVDGISHYIPFRYRVYIFDFDRASITDPKSMIPQPGYVNTTAQGVCQEYGTCNGYNPKFDTFKVLCVLDEISFGDYRELNNLIDRSTDLIPKARKAGPYCFIPRPEGLPDYIPPDMGRDFCKSPEMILKDTFFEDFKVIDSKIQFDSQTDDVKEMLSFFM